MVVVIELECIIDLSDIQVELLNLNFMVTIADKVIIP